MAEENTPVPPKEDDFGRIRDLAMKADQSRPNDVSESEWRRARIMAGHMVIIRAHFKSIFLIPLSVISFICGVAVVMGGSGANEVPGDWEHVWGLIWVFWFIFYMNIFIFEWNRAWTVVLLGAFVSIVSIGFAVNSPDFPVGSWIYDTLRNLRLVFGEQAYFFFAIFFALCALVSWIKTRLNYVVIEHNEMQIYRNAFFGDRERINMMHPRVEVRVTDMVEYFHPGYNSGTVVIHAPSKTIILENVLGIRKIERITDRLGSTLRVSIEHEARPT
ncbi:MAG: hypothetical protein V3W41_10160 [Planctomycetota bacterium]